MSSATMLYLFASSFGILSFFSTDMLVLRSLYLVSSGLFVVSAIVFQIPVMIVANCLYLTINAVQIIRLIIERTDIIIPTELKAIYHEVFSLMRPREFLQLMKIAKTTTIKNNEYIFRQGESCDYLLLIVSGKVSVEKDSIIEATLSDCAFVGEMHYLTQKPMSATIKALTDVSCLLWSHAQLEAMKIKKPDLYLRFITALCRYLAYKIQNQTFIH